MGSSSERTETHQDQVKKKEKKAELLLIEGNNELEPSSVSMMNKFTLTQITVGSLQKFRHRKLP